MLETPKSLHPNKVDDVEGLFIDPPNADHLTLKDRDDIRKPGAGDLDGPAIEIGEPSPLELKVGNTEERARLKTRWDVRRWRESVRTWIVSGLTGLFIILAILSLAIGWDVARNTTRELNEVAVLIGAVLSPTIGLLGAAVGFYFNEKNKRPEGSDDDG